MSFNSKLRQNEATFKLVRQVVEHVCTTNNLQFATVWPTDSTKECEHYERHFRRERRKNDPLRDVKKVRTAFSYFTQEQRPLITAKHHDLPFGEVSKLVGQQWASLDQTTRAKYQTEEAKDKTRYEGERQAIMQDIAMRAASNVPAIAEAVIPATPAKRAAPKRVVKAAVAVAAPVTAAVAAPVVAEAAPVVATATPAKRGGKKAVAAVAAPVVAVAASVVAEVAPVVAAAATPAVAAPVAAPAKRGGKKAAAAQASA
jgi:hypothetical protein